MSDLDSSLIPETKHVLTHLHYLKVSLYDACRKKSHNCTSFFPQHKGFRLYELACFICSSLTTHTLSTILTNRKMQQVAMKSVLDLIKLKIIYVHQHLTPKSGVLNHQRFTKHLQLNLGEVWKTSVWKTKCDYSLAVM